MRQRIILVVVALVASLITGELVLNLQKPISNAAQVSRTPSVVPADRQPATVLPTTTPVQSVSTAVPAAVSTQPSTPVIWIVTARQAITQGTLLLPEAVPQLFERTALNPPAPPGSVPSLSDLRILLSPTGRALATTVLAGDPLLLADIGYNGTGGPSLADQVPSGYVAVALDVAGVAGLQGVLTLGDDVDVMSAVPQSTKAVLACCSPLAGVQVRRLATARVISLGPLGNEITVAVPQAEAPVLVAADELQTHLHLVLRPWSGRLPTVIPTPPPPGGPPTPTVSRSRS